MQHSALLSNAADDVQSSEYIGREDNPLSIGCNVAKPDLCH
jgi:hypothetical protein